MISTIDRRALLSGALALSGGIAASNLLPGWARAQSHAHHRPAAAASPGVLSGEEIALEIGETPFTVGGRTGHAVTVNGTLPAPLIRLTEGQNVRLAVTNHLEEIGRAHV